MSVSPRLFLLVSGLNDKKASDDAFANDLKLDRSETEPIESIRSNRFLVVVELILHHDSRFVVNSQLIFKTLQEYYE
jgi:hypothetical protein